MNSHFGTSVSDGSKLLKRFSYMGRKLFLIAGVVLVLGLFGKEALGENVSSENQNGAALYQQMIDRAVRFLARIQAEDGSFAGYSSPAVTAIVATGLINNGRSPNDLIVAKALKYLEAHVQPDGGIYRPGTFYQNYETCIAMMCFAAANVDGRYDRILRNAERFVKKEQWDETEGIDASDFRYGGAGYGRHARPDLSNTHFLIDALRAVGRGQDDEAIRKAIIFVSRCQNFESEHNTTPFAAKNPDGGFYYTPAAGGVSMAGETPTGGLRSYGSMTYAGLKSMIYAGVGPDDPRVQAAYRWIRKHYDLQSNPGLGRAGLYYYYHVFAKALDALGEDIIVDEEGISHDWRRELLRELARRQQPDGSWVNDETRWMEGEPALVTGYVLLSLAYCKPEKLPKNPSPSP
jgi:squalene-hopene/tetraprenyl-beta-curcumene cyclase